MLDIINTLHCIARDKHKEQAMWSMPSDIFTSKTNIFVLSKQLYLFFIISSLNSWLKEISEIASNLFFWPCPHLIDSQSRNTAQATLNFAAKDKQHTLRWLIWWNQSTHSRSKAMSSQNISETLVRSGRICGNRSTVFSPLVYSTPSPPPPPLLLSAWRRVPTRNVTYSSTEFMFRVLSHKCSLTCWVFPAYSIPIYMTVTHPRPTLDLTILDVLHLFCFLIFNVSYQIGSLFCDN